MTTPSAPCPEDSTAGVTRARRADGESAAHRAQPDRDAALAEQLLGQRDAAHDGDADQGADHAEGEDRDVVERVDTRRYLQHEIERRAAQRVDHGDRDDRGDGDRGEGTEGVGADHQFEGVEGAGQRRVEGAGDGRRRRRSPPAGADRCAGPGTCDRSATPSPSRSGCSRPPARPRRRRRSTGSSAARRSGCRSATCARRTARWPRSGRRRGAGDSARSPGRAARAAGRPSSAPRRCGSDRVRPSR